MRRFVRDVVLMLFLISAVEGLVFPEIKSFLPKINSKTDSKTKVSDLLEAISNTNNGKTASTETQKRALFLARDLETSFPPSEQLLTDPKESKALDGIWYLQYTSPSVLDEQDDADVWKPNTPTDGGVPTPRFDAKGTISAQGITIDTSKRLAKQIIDVSNNVFNNEAELDFGKVTVEGTFYPSDIVPTRILAAFKDGIIEVRPLGVTIRLGWLFSTLAFLRGGKDVNGWIETTYVDADVRIARGNKGTMFVLTRDQDAVSP